MMEEKKFDHENYIQRRLREIDDLDERRFAKELLLENLGKLFTWMEEKYAALEHRIQDELDISWGHYYIFTTIVERTAYDPIGDFWFPVCTDDMDAVEEQGCKTIYLAADEENLKKFREQEILTGIDRESGQTISYRLAKAERYQKSMQKLHALFTSNHLPWRTIHMGHMERFFDLIPVGDAPPASEHALSFGEWDAYIRWGMIPLWNIERTEGRSMEYRLPCVDEVFYEHMIYLPDGNEEEGGYLVETREDILSIRHEEGKIILRAEADSIGEVFLYKVHQKKPEIRFGYQYSILSNRKKDNFAARYLRQTGNFIQTPMELCRKIEEMSGDYKIDVLGYEITDRVEGKTVNGDMDDFAGGSLFTMDRRSILLFRIRKEELQKEDYLYESQVRYVLTQLQMEFLEYRCMGVFV